MTKRRSRWLFPIYSAALLALGAYLGACYAAVKLWAPWVRTAPLAYSDTDRKYVEMALNAYKGHSAMTRKAILEEVFPLVVDFPDAVCVAFHGRAPGTGGGTICFDNRTDDLLTYYHPDFVGQKMPAKLARPHYGEVTLSGERSPLGSSEE